MTDEQIKQNAEAYANVFGRHMVDYYGVKDAYTAGAHSRDEEIESIYRNFKEEFDIQERQLNELRNDNKDLEQALACAEDVVDIQRKELEKLRNPWISVEELLPEEGQAVIVRLAFGAGNHAVCNYSNGQFVWALCIEASNVNIQSMLKLPAITHWMPIPELKKGE